MQSLLNNIYVFDLAMIRQCSAQSSIQYRIFKRHFNFDSTSPSLVNDACNEAVQDQCATIALLTGATLCSQCQFSAPVAVEADGL